MRDTWLGTCFGTRCRGLALVDLLLLGALLVRLGLGAIRLQPHIAQSCAYAVDSRLAPLIVWDTGEAIYSLWDPDVVLPTGVPVMQIEASSSQAMVVDFDDGQLHVGDRLISAHLQGKRWLKNPDPRGSGAWQATGWTFVVLHRGVAHTYHLTIPCS